MRTPFSASFVASAAFLASVGALVLACSAGTSGPYTPLNDGGPGGPSGEGGPAVPGADGGQADAAPLGATGSSANGELVIVNVAPTSQTLTGGSPLPTETSGVTFIAIVTDKAGLDAIAGGQLMDDSGATYAAFGAGANKGTYSATLDWTTMTSIHAADFGATGGKRTFVAKFFDNKNNVATAQVDLKLACRSDDTNELLGACGGQCTDVRMDTANCGSCGNACGQCFAGKCGGPTFTPDPTPGSGIVQTDCLAPSDFAPNTTCDALCNARGGTSACTFVRFFGAADATCGGAYTTDHTNNDCVLDLHAQIGRLRCRCTE